MIDLLDDHLGAMFWQAKWAFSNSIIFQDQPDGERFRELYEFWKTEIEKYLEANPAPWQ